MDFPAQWDEDDCQSAGRFDGGENHPEQYSIVTSMSALQERKYTCRVSSTLNRDTKQFGKKFLFDNRDETCWNSDQGSPQWISLEFQDYTSISGFSLQFQGGFAGKECYVETEGSVKVLDFYPEDSNKIQYFYLKERVTVKKIRNVPQ